MATKTTIETFVHLYMKAVEEGLTKEAFADRLGVKPSTVYQRAYELRAGGLDIPLLRSARQLSTVERARAALETYRASGKPNGAEKQAAPGAAVVSTDPLADLLG